MNKKRIIKSGNVTVAMENLATKIKNIKAGSCKTASLCDIINIYNLKGGF